MIFLRLKCIFTLLNFSSDIPKTFLNIYELLVYCNVYHVISMWNCGVTWQRWSLCLNIPLNGLFQKKSKQGGGVEDILFRNPIPPPLPLHQGFFLFFFTLPQEIPDKAKLNPWIFHKIVLNPLEIPRSKTKTPGKSTLFFLGHPWKFHFVFN